MALENLQKPKEDESLEGPTLYLAGINFAVFIVTSIWGRSLIQIGAAPLFFLGISQYTFFGGFIWTPLTSIFVHSGIAHIGGNLIFLFIYGFRIEEEGYHDNAVWSTYLLTGMLSSLLSMFILSPTSFSVGASGAVFGLLGANLGMERREGHPNYRQMIFATIILFIFSNTSPQTNIFAHLFGLFIGIFYGNSDYFAKFKKN
jgi:rhomboid protease GluP